MQTLHQRNGRNARHADDALPIVDAHHHLWDLARGSYPWLNDDYHADFFLGDYRALCRDVSAGDYLDASAGQRVIATVHVEADRARDEQLAETAWLHEVNKQYGFPNAVVAHAWFDRDNTDAMLAAQAAWPLVRGIRSKPLTAKTPGDSVAGQPGSMQDQRWLDGYALLEKHGLSWDLRVPAWHLEEAAQVAAQFPGISIALNHTGLPWDRSREGLRSWRHSMEVLARQPNAHVKLSEFGFKDTRWDLQSNQAVVRDTLAIFGAERCMFASNFPVSGLHADYDTTVDCVAGALAGAGRAVQEAVLCHNALRFYRIDAEASGAGAPA
ncbi:MAG: amidohydrolase family protein [Pseudomonadota bacterium]